MSSYRVPVAPQNVIQDFDTLTAFPEFMVEVTVLPKEMQLHQSYHDLDETADFFFSEVETIDEFEEEEDIWL